MNNYLKLVINSIVPFLMLGVVVSLMIGLLLMFSYILVWGLLIGVILWIVASVKEYFFPSTVSHKNKVILRGRIIEHHKDPK